MNERELLMRANELLLRIDFVLCVQEYRELRKMASAWVEEYEKWKQANQ